MKHSFSSNLIFVLHISFQSLSDLFLSCIIFSLVSLLSIISDIYFKFEVMIVAYFESHLFSVVLMVISG